MTDNRKAIPEMGMEAELLIARLGKADFGDIITYQEMSEIIGRNVRVYRWSLQTARNRLERSQQMVFGSVRGVGVRRLDDRGIVASSKANSDIIRRKATRAGKQLSCARLDSLSEEDRRMVFLRIGQFGLTRYLHGSAGEKRLTEKVGKVAKPITRKKIAQALIST